MQAKLSKRLSQSGIFNDNSNSIRISDEYFTPDYVTTEEKVKIATLLR